MSKPCVVGIDPGLDGAVAVLSGDGIRLVVFPTPILHGKGGKRSFDIQGMRDLFAIRIEPAALVVLEAVSARPGQGVTSMFNFGCGWGMWQGLMAGMGVPYQLVTPQKWKAAILNDTAKDKKAAVEFIQRRFPDVDLMATPRSRVPRDGMAEAAAMALYARQLLNGKAD